MTPRSARLGIGALALATLIGFSRGADLPGGPAARPAPTSPAAPSAAPGGPPATSVGADSGGKKLTVDDLLATRQPVAFHFESAPITDIINYIAKSYDLRVENQYPFTDLLTVEDSAKLTARQAIDILNGTILALGYTVVESVRKGPDGPQVVLTIVPTKKDAGRIVPVFRGNDPAEIPEDQAMRTQILSLHGVDPDKARAMIVAVVGAQADVTLNAATQTLIITDTGAHVHTAAALLQTLAQPPATLP